MILHTIGHEVPDWFYDDYELNFDYEIGQEIIIQSLDIRGVLDEFTIDPPYLTAYIKVERDFDYNQLPDGIDYDNGHVIVHVRFNMKTGEVPYFEGGKNDQR